MRSLMLAFALATVAAGPVLAQGTVSTARPAPPEAAALTAPVLAGPAVRIPQARLDLAREVYALIGPTTTASSLRDIRTAMRLQFANVLEDRKIERIKAMVEAVNDGMNSLTPQITDAGVSALARNFTDQQLMDMKAFYSSPTGRAVILKLPLVSNSASHTIIDHLGELMAGVEDSFCNRVRCSSRERKGLDGVAERLSAIHPET